GSTEVLRRAAPRALQRRVCATDRSRRSRSRPAHRAAGLAPLRVLLGLALAESLPPPLRAALADYEEGRFFAALARLNGMLAARAPAYALDDASFLRA